VAAIKILVGTMTGTAELVAEEISDELSGMGHQVEVEPMDGLDATAFQPGTVYLICTSTYGQGDVPDNAMKLLEDLGDRKPDLSDIRYGIIALGDRTYADTFCFGGLLFDKALAELNAERIGDILEHDASDGTIPEEAGLEWAKEWVHLIADQDEAA